MIFAPLYSFSVHTDTPVKNRSINQLSSTYALYSQTLRRTANYMITCQRGAQAYEPGWRNCNHLSQAKQFFSDNR